MFSVKICCFILYYKANLSVLVFRLVPRFLIIEKQVTSPLSNWLEKEVYKSSVFWKKSGHGLSKMATLSSPRTLNPSEIAVLQSIHEEQLSGALLGVPYPKKNDKEPVYSPPLYSTVVISIAFSRVPFICLFFPRTLITSALIRVYN